jgi:hypothetical protein
VNKISFFAILSDSDKGHLTLLEIMEITLVNKTVLRSCPDLPLLIIYTFFVLWKPYHIIHANVLFCKQITFLNDCNSRGWSNSQVDACASFFVVFYESPNFFYDALVMN